MTRLLPLDALETVGRVPGRRARVVAIVAAVALLVPGTALGDAGSSTSALTLLESIAGHSQQLAGLLDDTNAQMTRLETDLGEIKGLDAQMATLVDQTGALRSSTDTLSSRLGGVGDRIDGQGRTLRTVSRQVAGLGSRMSALQGAVAGQLATTRTMSTNFGTIAGDMHGMAGDFDALIRQMGLSRDRVGYFAGNDLLRLYPGGDSTVYQNLNLAPKTRVMSIMLPMITTLQSGGRLISTTTATEIDPNNPNDLLAKLLAVYVPDRSAYGGLNVLSTVHRYDGRYGLPPAAYFLRQSVGGF
jgi:uncharacterized protein YoxC